MNSEDTQVSRETSTDFSDIVIGPEQRIILSIGGFKYETYRSTLTSYPDTLLGTMFLERNKSLLRPNNDNEYFFDRDGYIFRYIIQFYRTGEIFWPDTNPLPPPCYHSDLNSNNNNQLQICSHFPNITNKELIAELTYFQIPFPPQKPLSITQQAILDNMNLMITTLEQVIRFMSSVFLLKTTINFGVDSTNNSIITCNRFHESEINEIVKSIYNFAYIMFISFGQRIAKKINRDNPEVELKFTKIRRRVEVEISIVYDDFNLDSVWNGNE
ncbi:hypothetical protein Glove_575g43 [Diversispora epigaea]|uniref:BTB domain-containing protein n=1 Tax=Diversispora epigaea TaxID=1348612 RepID=A0A397G9D2_9GLOM|nr:hypothetical protein Glove_575g43 [Diversispora epigaea]